MTGMYNDLLQQHVGKFHCRKQVAFNGSNALCRKIDADLLGIHAVFQSEKNCRDYWAEGPFLSIPESALRATIKCAKNNLSRAIFAARIFHSGYFYWTKRFADKRLSKE